MTRSVVSAPLPDLSHGARYFTPRSLERKTYGPEVSRISARLGAPFMPWQNMVVDTALEVDPETGLLAYRFVIIKVPRQAGKTTLTLALATHRAIAFANVNGRPQNIIYTAQTAQDAFKKWSDQSDELQAVLKHRVHKRGGNNTPTLTFKNGSEYRPISVTKKSGPSQSNDLLLYDEAWGHEDGRIEAGLGPTTIARVQPQSWIYSNAGTRDSHWWRGKWKMGRELALEGDTSSGIAYFEWSGDRDDPDYDPASPEYAAKHHPAAGITIDIAGFKAEYRAMLANPDEGLEGYERAYLNLEPAAAIENWLIVTKPQWEATGSDDSYIVGPRAFALDITNDRAWASVGWAGKNAAEVDHAEVIKHERGTGWIVKYFVDMFTRYPKYERVVYVVAGGQAALEQADLEEAELGDDGPKIRVVRLDRADYAKACADYYDSITDETAVHLATGQAPLESAIAGAAWGVGAARTWSPAKSTTVISPLVAVTAATWGHALAQSNAYDVLDSIA
jgi:hypothetical protein